MLLPPLFCTEMSCQEQGYPKISWWYLRKWEGHCGWGRMRGAIPVASTWWSSVQASFFNLLGFQKSFKYNICWILARVSVFRSFVMWWDCFCIFLLCPWSTKMSYSLYTFDSKTSISNTSFSEKQLQLFRIRIKCNTPWIRIYLQRNSLSLAYIINRIRKIQIQ